MSINRFLYFASLVMFTLTSGQGIAGIPTNEFLIGSMDAVVPQFSIQSANIASTWNQLVLTSGVPINFVVVDGAGFGKSDFSCSATKPLRSILDDTVRHFPDYTYYQDPSTSTIWLVPKNVSLPDALRTIIRVGRAEWGVPFLGGVLEPMSDLGLCGSDPYIHCMFCGIGANIPVKLAAGDYSLFQFFSVVSQMNSHFYFRITIAGDQPPGILALSVRGSQTSVARPGDELFAKAFFRVPRPELSILRKFAAFGTNEDRQVVLQYLDRIALQIDSERYVSDAESPEIAAWAAISYASLKAPVTMSGIPQNIQDVLLQTARSNDSFTSRTTRVVAAANLMKCTGVSAEVLNLIKQPALTDSEVADIAGPLRSAMRGRVPMGDRSVFDPAPQVKSSATPFAVELDAALSKGAPGWMARNVPAAPWLKSGPVPLAAEISILP